MTPITQAEFDEWLESSVTKRFKEKVEKEIEYMRFMLEQTSEESLKEIQGRISASRGLLVITYEDLYE